MGVTTDTRDAPESWRLWKSHHSVCARVEKMWHLWGVFLQKAIWACIKWALNCDTSFLNSLKELAPFEERTGCVGHLQDPHQVGEVTGQLPGGWDTEVEQLTDSKALARGISSQSAWIRLQVHCKGVIFSCPVHFWQKYFPTSPSPNPTHHGKLCLGKHCLGVQPR